MIRFIDGIYTIGNSYAEKCIFHFHETSDKYVICDNTNIDDMNISWLKQFGKNSYFDSVPEVGKLLYEQPQLLL